MNSFQCPEMPFGSVRRGKVEHDVRLARMVDWKVSLGIFLLINKCPKFTVHQIAVEFNVILGIPATLDAGIRLLFFCQPFEHGHGFSGFKPLWKLVTHSRQREERHDPHFEALERGSVFSRCKLDEELAMSRHVRILSRFCHGHLHRDKYKG